MTSKGNTRGRPVGLLINPDAARHVLGDRPQSWWASAAKIAPGNLSEVLTGQKGVTTSVAHRLAGAVDVPVGLLFPELVEFSTTIRHFTAPKAEAA